MNWPEGTAYTCVLHTAANIYRKVEDLRRPPNITAYIQHGEPTTRGHTRTLEGIAVRRLFSLSLSHSLYKPYCHHPLIHTHTQTLFSNTMLLCSCSAVGRLESPQDKFTEALSPSTLSLRWARFEYGMVRGSQRSLANLSHKHKVGACVPAARPAGLGATKTGK